MANPNPVPYSQATHKPDCRCPACRKRTGREKKRLGVLLEPELEEWLRIESDRTGETMTEIIERGIRMMKPAEYYEGIGDALRGQEAERAYRKAQNAAAPHEPGYMETVKRLQGKIVGALEQQ